LNVYADGTKSRESIGRSGKRSIVIKVKAISADHCSITYDKPKGWVLHEKGKAKLSSNGTFVFLKNYH